MTFDWSWWPATSAKPLILAGGLTPVNVGEAIRRTRPFAVDVSSGVEGAAEGVKDPAKIEQFMIEVRRANARELTTRMRRRRVTVTLGRTAVVSSRRR